jgi:hypothetical protein
MIAVIQANVQRTNLGIVISFPGVKMAGGQIVLSRAGLVPGGGVGVK